MKSGDAQKKQSIKIWIISGALVCIGYVLSLFLTYGFTVMPALAQVDDTTFVTMFQALESRFAFEPSGYSNIPIMIAFPGAIVLTTVSAAISRKEHYGRWLIAAALLFMTGIATSVIFNVPSNDMIYTAGDPSLVNATQVRADFDETAWANWNHFRSITSLLAAGCLIKALREVYSMQKSLRERVLMASVQILT